jgi:CheY-like chemotaxis protein
MQASIAVALVTVVPAPHLPSGAAVLPDVDDDDVVDDADGVAFVVDGSAGAAFVFPPPHATTKDEDKRRKDGMRFRMRHWVVQNPAASERSGLRVAPAAGGREPSMATARPNDARPRKILLVEDSAEVRELYEIALVDKGYEVKTAALAEDALQLLHDGFRPDVIVTDLFMPGIGGLELITRVRSDLVPPVPPVVVVSGFPDAMDEALRRGAARFETKPLSLNELVHVVEDTISGSPELRTPGPDTIRKRRDATRAVGEAMLARLLAEDPDVMNRVHVQVTATARFFDLGAVLVFFLRKGKLILTAASDPKFPPGTDAAVFMPLLIDVLEAGTSLVLTSGTSRWLRLPTESSPFQFLVAVPYVVDGAGVGVLCIVDVVPHRFGNSPLSILEYVARRASAVLRGGTKLTDASGLLDRATMATMLGASLSTATEARWALGISLLETAELPSDGSLGTLIANLPAPHLMIGFFDRRHVVAFAVAESVERVKNRLSLARGLVETRLAVSAVAELTYEDPVPCRTAEDLFAQVIELVERAAQERGSESQAFLAIDACRRRAS